MAFTNVDADTFLFIRSEPLESEWVGAVSGSASEIIGPVGGVDQGEVWISNRLRIHKVWLLREKKPGNGADVRLCPNRQPSILSEAVPKKQNPEKRKKQGWQRREKRLKKKLVWQAGKRSRLLMYRHLETADCGDYACHILLGIFMCGGDEFRQMGADCFGFVQVCV